MAKSITIYTTTTCPSCVMVKRYLDSKGQSYEVINVDEHPEKRQTAIDVAGGAMTVPITVIKDDTSGQQKVSVGWNPGQLVAALAA